MEITRQEMNEFWAQEQASAREVQGHLLASQRTVVGTIAECALGCNARTYNPICNAHAPKPPAQPIPEPAPELCAQPGCCAGRPVRGPGTRAEHDRSLPEKECCHPFVAPQAKPLIAKPADVHAGPPITGTFHNVQAKPVLRELKPRADGYPDVCLECRGEKGVYAYVCQPCFSRLPPQVFAGLFMAWAAAHPGPAAKYIPSPPQHMVIMAGRQAGKSKRMEQGPSAVAAAPAIEPWRPTVDDWDLLPDAETGWR